MSATKHIRILESVASDRYAYGRGYEGHVPADIADDLIRAGHAVAVTAVPDAKTAQQKAEKATSPQAKTAEKR